MNRDVLIIGAGLAGLSCAHSLHRQGISYLALEASDAIGGRVRTDRVEEFLLDRGFQVFSTAYPEATALLDYDALHLRHFFPGAMIRFNNKWHRIADPFRRPLASLRTLFTPIGSWTDKLRVAKLRHRTLAGSVQELFTRPEASTLEFLQHLGFTSTMIERFFRPFLGGIFLDPELETSSRMTEFIFRMFASGYNSLPSEGMEAIPRQLGTVLSPTTLRTQARVTTLRQTTVTLESGETLSARAVVMAVEGPAAAQLIPSLATRPHRSVANLYFAALDPPVQGPYLLLNGERAGPINNLCVISQVAPSYSQTTRQLISISVLAPTSRSNNHLESQVRQQLRDWFGRQTDDWEHIRTSIINEAQPQQNVPGPNPYTWQPHLGNGLFICGDFCATGTIEGAMFSGRRAAEEVYAWLTR